jgi:aryl-alcohol dehydrogenase-like predicted oxidoreductase
MIMEYRKLGQSGVEASVITFGAWAIGGWMWGGADMKDAVEAILASYHEGVTSIDTAPIYGMGLSEKIVGEALRQLPRDKVQILTKYGMSWQGEKGEFFFDSKDNDGKDIKIYKYAGKEQVIWECEQSLKRLGVDYIDLYQIHWPDNTTPIAETMEAVATLLKQGKIRAAGVCNYNKRQMLEAESVLTLASNQVPFSMINRKIEEELVPYAIPAQKSILAYSPLQRGVLTGKFKAAHDFKEGDSRQGTTWYKPENIERINSFLDKLRPLAQEKGATISQLVLRWTIDRPGITIALAGARNAEQARENAKAATIALTASDLEFINAQMDKIVLI